MKDEWIGRWAGKTVVCIASGPSLTEEDCETVRQSGHPTIVTNTTFRLCPWAEVLFAFDARWWMTYIAEVDEKFKGARLSYGPTKRFPGVPTLQNEKWFSHFHNSGACAISLAVLGGASKVVLLGYDCKKTDGKTHWHGDHPKHLGNARSIGNWPVQFKNVSRYAADKRVPVVNCSRETALTMFPRAALAESL